MALDKPLDQITQADLELLKTTGEAEGKTLDYKLTVYTDNDKWECRADITSFANTAGGHLIFGVEEEGGLPVAIPGLGREPDPDKVKLRLEQVLGANIEPRLPHVGMHPVWLDNGGWCLVVRVPHSWAQPHAVVRDQTPRFWARHSSGKYLMDAGQLRSAFTLSSNVEERIRDFRIGRLNLLAAVDDFTRVVMHLIPVSAFTSDTRFDLNLIKNGGQVCDMRRWGSNYRFTLDGLLARHIHTGEQTPQTNFAVIFRNGTVEAVEVHDREPVLQGPPCFVGYGHDAILVESLGQLLEIQKALGVEPPIFVMLTLLRVKGWSINIDRMPYGIPKTRLIDRDTLPLTPTMIEDYATPPEIIMREILDEFWQASGWSRCLSYDENGSWTPQD